MALYQDWDGVLKAGSYSRASSSDIVIFGEENLTTDDLPYGHAVAFNANGGVKKYTATTDVYAGVVVKGCLRWRCCSKQSYCERG